MFVKICGITNCEDAFAAIDAGARAVGFIFHPKSPRFISPESLQEWIGELPSDVWRVGVFVDQPREYVAQTCRRLGLDVAQLHGSESVADLPDGVRVWKAFRLSGQIPSNASSYPVEAVLLDGASSGRTFDWSVARTIHVPVVLAGGLDEQNVREAIATAEPWGVDACSSLEISPGRKDHARVARFLKACQPELVNQI